MYRAIPKRLWEKPLDISLYSTNEGELQIPFSHFVLPTPAVGSSGRDFPQFSQLPAELQLRILPFCDDQTLSQLMHTSSTFRSNANKLFFSSLDTWYCINADWISEGCLPGDTIYDVQFLPMVEQLEVQFEGIDEDYWLLNYCITGDTEGFQYESEEEDGVAAQLEQCFHDFWQRLHAQFPRVVRVMLQCNDFWRPPCDSPPEIFKQLARTCGNHTEISFSLLKTWKKVGYQNRQAERSIWHQSPDSMTSDTTEWEESLHELKPRVMLPVKEFRGPLGAYQCSIYRRLQCLYFRHTIVVMLIAATERHHFLRQNSPFQCPAPRCSVVFSLPGEFTSHVISNSRHREHIVPLEQYSLLFDKADARLEALKHNANKAEQVFQHQWGQNGTERRIATEQAALQQVASDVLYASEKSGYGSHIIIRALKALDSIT